MNIEDWPKTPIFYIFTFFKPLINNITVSNIIDNYIFKNNFHLKISFIVNLDIFNY